MNAFPEVIQEDFIHEALETSMHFARLAVGIVAITRCDDAHTAEL